MKRGKKSKNIKTKFKSHRFFSQNYSEDTVGLCCLRKLSYPRHPSNSKACHPVIPPKVKQEFTINLIFPKNYLLGLSLLSQHPPKSYVLCTTQPERDSTTSSKSAKPNAYYQLDLLSWLLFAPSKRREEMNL